MSFNLLSAKFISAAAVCEIAVGRLHGALFFLDMNLDARGGDVG